MTPSEIRREAAQVASRMDAVYDALVEKSYGSGTAANWVQGLAESGFFNEEPE